MSAQPPNHQSITTSPGKAKQSKPRTMVETPRNRAVEQLDGAAVLGGQNLRSFAVSADTEARDFATKQRRVGTRADVEDAAQILSCRRSVPSGRPLDRLSKPEQLGIAFLWRRFPFSPRCHPHCDGQGSVQTPTCTPHSHTFSLHTLLESGRAPKNESKGCAAPSPGRTGWSLLDLLRRCTL
eukprot:scaffold895_cov315-Pinguiococcus_pyrenoidosus.AAC.73